MLDRGVVDAISQQHLPVMVVGLENILPIYRDASKLNHLLDDGINKNPDSMDIQELHVLAWKAFTKQKVSPIEQAIEQYKNLLGTEKSNDELSSIALATAYGKVDKVLIEKSVQIWGQVNTDQKEVVVKENREEPEDRDLLDVSVRQTLLHGGEVFVLEEDQMPTEDSPVAAIYRY
jgi:hypothetical protein